ncbi:diguanylate cyclase (GGDEF) domain-containing protein [Micromonospora echinaurantiaca]|uniref:Diguanylate cyclase (GGDEF) domain-containing protein n=1 Tax=Micromonospora echinaurantiaca TaxID=47857 RepID=A0A1C5KDJ0_9ACTN|nr:GGDEF domain-containing protein [Micromonospora echinaurantiaca]SCG80629.1 diguanylate cyclase (GGDEF) domain-containing protein [Micromonospora echinaurantiaca]
MTPRLRALITATAISAAATAGYLTARHSLRAELATVRHTATHDPLTGIHNRAGLTAAADTLIRTAHSTSRPVAVVLVDLVGFKKVNDTHGHDAGDHILTTVANRLAGIAGPAGIAARLGGDEFAVITTGPATRRGDAATWLADWLTHIHTRLTTPVSYDSRPLAVGATLGAVLADPGHPAAVWLHRADLAMYAARANRRTTAVFTDTTDTPADLRATDRPRDLARPTSLLAAAPTSWRAA